MDMKEQGMDVLLVGSKFPGTPALLNRLEQRGFRFHFASTRRTAIEVLNSNLVDVVLIHTSLPDGSGYDLANCLSGMPITAYVCTPVEEGWYWLPALFRGQNCWGAPAIRPGGLARELDRLGRWEVTESGKKD